MWRGELLGVILQLVQLCFVSEVMKMTQRNCSRSYRESRGRGRKSKRDWYVDSPLILCTNWIPSLLCGFRRWRRRRKKRK